MRELILSSLSDATQLEKLYRADKSAYRKAFNALYPDLQDNPLASFWNARLNYSQEDIFWGTRKDWVWLILACLVAAVLAKLPSIIGIEEEFYYSRNVGFIIFPVLSAYFAWKNNLSMKKIAFLVAVTIGSAIFINVLPGSAKSDTVSLSCIHLCFLLWSALGIAFAGDDREGGRKRLAYLTYNGDLVVMTTLIVIAGALLSAATIGLFSLIGWNIEKFYFQNVVTCGLPAAPILGTYLTQANPQLVSKVSPVIAKIFSPLVLVMLVIYLVAIMYSGKDPYNDREFLLMFNALLIGVLAIIFFSVAGIKGESDSKSGVWVLLLLSLLTVLVNGIALSAVVFRISNWGITPNRAAVLGGNVLILVNLLMVTAQLFLVLRRKREIGEVGTAISSYLPVYAVWALIVTFIFPFLFGFR